MTSGPTVLHSSSFLQPLEEFTMEARRMWLYLSVASFLVLASVSPTFVVEMVTKDNDIYTRNPYLLPISGSVGIGLTVLYFINLLCCVNRVQTHSSSEKISRLGVMELTLSIWIIFPKMVKPDLSIIDLITALSATVLGHTIYSLFFCGNKYRNEDWLYMLRSIAGNVTIFLIVKGNRYGYAGIAIFWLLMGACVNCEKRCYNNASPRESSVSGLDVFHNISLLLRHLKIVLLCLSIASFLVLASVFPAFVAETVTKDNDIYARNPYFLPISVSVGIGFTVLYLISLLSCVNRVRALSSKGKNNLSLVLEFILSIWIIFPKMMKPDLSMIDLITVLSGIVLSRTIYSLFFGGEEYRSEDWLYMLRSITGNVTIFLIAKGNCYGYGGIAIFWLLMGACVSCEQHCYNNAPPRESSVSGLEVTSGTSSLVKHLKKFAMEARSVWLSLSTASFLVLASVSPTFVAEMLMKDNEIYARNPYILPISVSVEIGSTVLYVISLLYCLNRVQIRALSSKEKNNLSLVLELILSIWIIFPKMMKPDLSIIDLITIMSATVLSRTIYSLFFGGEEYRSKDWLYMMRSIAGNVTIFLIVKGNRYGYAGIAIFLLLMGACVNCEQRCYNHSLPRESSM